MQCIRDFSDSQMSKIGIRGPRLELRAIISSGIDQDLSRK